MTHHANGNEQGSPVVYRQTLILRILCLITVVPLGVLLIMITLEDNGSFICLVVGSILLLVTAFVWINGYIFKMRLSNDEITRKNLFGARSIKIDKNTKFFHRNVKEFINGIPVGQHVFITIKNGSSSIRLNSNIKNIELLQRELMNLEGKHILPHCESQYGLGSLVDFGPFKLRQGTLYYKNKPILLREVSGFVLKNGKLKISQWDKRFSFCHVKVSDIANMTSFFALLESATTEHGR